ncbi:hypothetical protein H4219_003156 [Mycoemilia scoparia]|uniref:Uncharacterized protein n=1 Tax=Mycoemilia scoparia TaxID=417184 RepID=A0A9W7ZVM9_9FUNG|nr:hypothetical protein H4219_003156 [Mycoemilia scoparia]
MADDKCTTDKTEVHGEQGPNTKVKYVPQLPNAPYQPPNEILAQIAPTSHPHVVFNKSLRPQDMEKDDFKRFGEISIDLRQKMRALVDASEEMNIRIGLQQKEHERQKSKLSELSSNLNQGIIPKIHGHMDRLKSLKENQNKIGLRIDCLIRDLVDHCQLPLSQIEVNFIKFVRELDGKVSGPGGCQGQLDQLTELFQKLNRETQAFNKKSQERDRPHDRFSTRLDYIDAGHDDRRGSLSPSSYLSPKTQNPSNQRFGAHQLKAIEDALSSEQRLLNETIANINEANQELSKFKA